MLTRSPSIVLWRAEDILIIDFSLKDGPFGPSFFILVQRTCISVLNYLLSLR